MSDRLEAPSDLLLGAPNQHSKFGLDYLTTVAVHSENTHAHAHAHAHTRTRAHAHAHTQMQA